MRLEIDTSYKPGSYTTKYVYGGSEKLWQTVIHEEGVTDTDFGANANTDVAIDGIWAAFYHLDRLGSTAFVTTAAEVDDGNGGVTIVSSVLAYAQYDEWGNAANSVNFTALYGEADVYAMNTAGVEGIHNFTGHGYDQVLELYFAKARFYSAEVKRFTQADPINGYNLYYYCGNNPVNYVDPDGMEELSIRAYLKEYEKQYYTFVDWNQAAKTAIFRLGSETLYVYNYVTGTNNKNITIKYKNDYCVADRQELNKAFFGSYAGPKTGGGTTTSQSGGGSGGYNNTQSSTGSSSSNNTSSGGYAPSPPAYLGEPDFEPLYVYTFSFGILDIIKDLLSNKGYQSNEIGCVMSTTGAEALVGTGFNIGTGGSIAGASAPAFGIFASILGIGTQELFEQIFNPKPLSPEVVEQEIGRIFGRYGIGQCVEAAKEAENYLRKNNKNFEVVSIQYPPGNANIGGYVFSRSRGGNYISSNGYHVGISYNQKIHCNVHPLGLSIPAWLNDFEGYGSWSVSPAQYQVLKTM